MDGFVLYYIVSVILNIIWTYMIIRIRKKQDKTFRIAEDGDEVKLFFFYMALSPITVAFTCFGLFFIFADRD